MVELLQSDSSCQRMQLVLSEKLRYSGLLQGGVL